MKTQHAVAEPGLVKEQSLRERLEGLLANATEDAGVSDANLWQNQIALLVVKATNMAVAEMVHSPLAQAASAIQELRFALATLIDVAASVSEVPETVADLVRPATTTALPSKQAEVPQADPPEIVDGVNAPAKDE